MDRDDVLREVACRLALLYLGLKCPEVDNDLAAVKLVDDLAETVRKERS